VIVAPLTALVALVYAVRARSRTGIVLDQAMTAVWSQHPLYT
jgi:hypothetical protein